MISVDSIFVATTLFLVTGILGGSQTAATPEKSGYGELSRFYVEFRAFQKPKLVAGVPDYSAAAMAAQKRELETYRRRLAAMDPGKWPVPQQVDYEIVRAELNGVDFEHRVLKPWVNNPAFYVTVFAEESDQPKREGPSAEGAVEIWSHEFPLSPEAAAKVQAGIRAVPGLLAQAKTNLTGNGRDLWVFGIGSIRQQSADLAELGKKVSGGLKSDVEKARKATDEFAAWLESRSSSKSGPSGVGIENYDWYLKNVQLVPYTWAQEVALMERELARSRALLAMEEIRNAKLPVQEPVSSAEQYDRDFNAAVTEYMAFLRDREILTVKPYMEPALRARIGRFREGPREFFSEVGYRDPQIMRTHDYHWFDKAWMVEEPPASPIRRQVRLFNLDNTRTEGLATGWEETMMQAGMFDARPRSRELVYILVAQRAARALGELFMVANRMTLEQAAGFACAHTPRGWLSMEGNLVRGEQHLYLQQPGYGTSYLIGKMILDDLLAERKQELGEQFRMKAFMDELNAVGLIPASLVRWEMTGRKPEFLQ